jgi:mono/diheme cytochrome c family protein/glucose/arabinose dehydrogenase
MRRAVLIGLTGWALSLAVSLPAQQSQAPSAPAPGGGRAGAPVRMGGAGVNDPANAAADFSPKAPVLPLRPEEQLTRFILPPGYRLELVLADPLVLSPAAMAFDPNGRLYIAEMRTFMRDADGTGQLEPKSRISMHESSRGDGVYDRHFVFADNLVLPRMILPLDRGILTNETRSDDVVRLVDTDGDGRADRRELFYTGVGSNRDGNVQHEQSGFVWGLDNWIYSTYNAFRFRWTPSGIVREPSGPPSAEWGLTMDDDGKMWFVNSGGERGPVNFQVPIQYGAFNTPDQFEPGFEVVWPAPGIGDMQGGLPRVRQPINALNHFTSTNGQEIVRSDRYPDMMGDLLFADPVGRLIRRARVVTSEGLTQLRNVYPGSEFITSTDPLFRPLNIKQGPDGALYILDMYNGIIQDANWTGRGTYLRARIEQFQLDKVTNLGRVWRLRFDGIPATPATATMPARPGVPAIPLDRTVPRMLDETPAQLVRHLTHANGWWRDTAQRLLVLKQDKSVVPALRSLAAASGDGTVLVGRFHALWTLEGLGALDAALVRGLMKDSAPRMRVQAIRASETLYKAGDRTFVDDYRLMAADADAGVAIQAMLTLNLFKAPDVASVIRSAQAGNAARGVKAIGDLLLNPPAAGRGGGRGGAAVNPAVQQMMERGAAIYTELCFSCHGDDGRGQPLSGAPAGTLMAPSLSGSPRVNGHRDYVINALVHGLTGPVDGASYSQVMVPMGASTDEWIASIATYVRASFGNGGGLVTAADVARVRATTAGRSAPWTAADLEASLPRHLDPQASWRLTASHNAAAAAGVLSMRGWTSGAPQAAGMWVQIELPQAVSLTEIQFDVPAGRGVTGTAVPYPRAYRVEVSMNGTAWGAPVAEGTGAPGRTFVSFAPVQARFVRITQTDPAPNAPAWTLANVRLYAAGAGR